MDVGKAQRRVHFLAVVPFAGLLNVSSLGDWLGYAQVGSRITNVDNYIRFSPSKYMLLGQHGQLPEPGPGIHLATAIPNLPFKLAARAQGELLPAWGPLVYKVATHTSAVNQIKAMLRLKALLRADAYLPSGSPRTLNLRLRQCGALDMTSFRRTSNHLNILRDRVHER